MPATFVATARVLPLNATIIANPLETYLHKHPGDSNAADSKIIVAAESRALRTILPVVDGQDKVEAILDLGCQVVAMSEEICNALALHYDPTIRLHMMSTNGSVDQSLGLAWNVYSLLEISRYTSRFTFSALWPMIFYWVSPSTFSPSQSSGIMPTRTRPLPSRTRIPATRLRFLPFCVVVSASPIVG